MSEDKSDASWSNTADDTTGTHITRLEAENADLKDRLLRALAEQENLRRRVARERDDAVRFAASAFARDLLETTDNLRRALAEADKNPAAENTIMQNLLLGLEATERGLLNEFAKHGIRLINAALGETFDPQWHQAMVEVEDATLPDGSIARVLQPGYAHYERLLRPALVDVAKGAATASSSQSADGADRDGRPTLGSA